MSSQEDESTAGLPRSATPNGPATRRSLLPAFEPFSSSPNLPRPPKRKFEDSPSMERNRLKFFPTPIPTSATGILPSSPPAHSSTRPALPRSFSTLSERVPLGAVPSVALTKDGEPLLMGRSSNSSHYQLSANRLISRIHVRATYRAANGINTHGEVYIECLGWNGAKVHCRGKVYELGKGDTFSSDKPKADIMLDVQNARVLLRWPPLDTALSPSSSPHATWSEEDSPLPRNDMTSRFPSSPPQALAHLHSPVSPSPRDRVTTSSTFLGMPSVSSPRRPSVEVYEDEVSEDEPLLHTKLTPGQTEPETLSSIKATSQHSSVLSDLDSPSDNDEENDPVVHAFGPFGENLQSRMASISASSPNQQRLDSSTKSSSPIRIECYPSSTSINLSPVRNHVINQLAFSRLHSLPLSTIMNNLPASLKDLEEDNEGSRTNNSSKLTDVDLKSLLDDIPCVGEIIREGKDAAGKRLEDEFYYVPEEDSDDMRRNAVQQKPGLRNVRKQHKQYYWKRPR